MVCKAQKINTYEWVRGFFAEDANGQAWILCPDGGCGGEWKKAHVEPGTICRHTGETDKNRTEIWENDIVAYTKNNGKKTVYGTVRFGKHNVCDLGFFIQWEDNCAYREELLYWTRHGKVAVVGNAAGMAVGG